MFSPLPDGEMESEEPSVRSIETNGAVYLFFSINYHYLDDYEALKSALYIAKGAPQQGRIVDPNLPEEEFDEENLLPQNGNSFMIVLIYF